MRTFRVDVDRGVNRAAGLLAGHGMLLRAQNARYLPGHPDALYALLGRALFDSATLPDPSVASSDPNPKRLFSVVFDDGTKKLVLHVGGVLYEALLAGSGTLAEAYALVSGMNTAAPAGIACSYADKWFYICGNAAGIDWGASTYRRAFTRTSSGWRRMGHGKPPVPLVATALGTLFGGDPGPNFPVFSNTPVRYLWRVYDQTTDTESQRSDYVEIPAFTGPEGVGVYWPTAPSSATDLGTHVRLYRTLRNQPPGAFFRIDGNGPGWTFAFVAANYYDATHRFVDLVENDTAIENGSVNADGIEGEEAWAEWGGPVPPARGGTIFQDRMVVWGVVGDEDAIYWSAIAQPELFPVKFDGTYPYRMTFQSKRKDRVQTCVAAGDFLIVLGEEALFRVQVLRDYNGAGADLRTQALITDEDGCVGILAAAPFGIGKGQAQYVVYVSRKSGICLTDGFHNDAILKELDFLSLVDPAYIQNVVIENYPRFQELVVAYTPVGGNRNTQAIIVDYSSLSGKRGGLRVTWPVDVRALDLHHATGTDGLGRLYVLDQDSRVYVQDSGSVDAQHNSNEDGDIIFDVQTARETPAGQGNTVHALRGFLYGSSGVARTFKTTHSAQDGLEEYDQIDTVQLGPGETSDHFDANGRGSGHRLRLYRLGPTGDSYDGSGTDAPHIHFIDLELVGPATQPRTRTTP